MHLQNMNFWKLEMKSIEKTNIMGSGENEDMILGKMDVNHSTELIILSEHVSRTLKLP